MSSNLLINAIGSAAAVCSAASFIPQIIKMVKEKNAKAVSLRMYAVTVTGFTLWLAYGFALRSWPLVVSNGVSLTLSAIILILKLRYRQSSSSATG